ncbi:MAG: sulfatase-like hydrolase/transferase, partial [Akkermansiaceae bacterium]
MKRTILTLASCLIPLVASAAQLPNIIFILADDMGVGDVSHTTGKAQTPALDQLAKEGMRFTNAHTSSSVCSPTRYGIMTGRYNWRSWLKSAVIWSPDARGPMITADRLTVPAFLKKNGYHTALVGKWHLGLKWTYLDQKRTPEHTSKYKKNGSGWDIDYTQKVRGGPTTLGFDQSFFIAGSLDMAPYVYLKNDKALSIPTHVKAFHRPGASAADFEASECLSDFARESVSYINARAKTKQPFFLYLPLTSPHTP